MVAPFGFWGGESWQGAALCSDYRGLKRFWAFSALNEGFSDLICDDSILN